MQLPKKREIFLLASFALVLLLLISQQTYNRLKDYQEKENEKFWKRHQESEQKKRIQEESDQQKKMEFYQEQEEEMLVFSIRPPLLASLGDSLGDGGNLET